MLQILWIHSSAVRPTMEYSREILERKSIEEVQPGALTLVYVQTSQMIVVWWRKVQTGACYLQTQSTLQLSCSVATIAQTLGILSAVYGNRVSLDKL